MSNEVIFILYLIYGFIYIYLGIIIFQLKNKELSGFSIIRTLHLLGLFGVIHGLSEWITLAQVSGIYNEYSGYLLFTKEVFKVISFYFLLRFSIDVVPKKIDLHKSSKRIVSFVRYIPMVLLISWLMRFVYLSNVYGFQYLENNRAGSVIITRYLMSLPAGVIGFIGLYLAGRKIRNMYEPRLYVWFYGLSITLLLYGFIDGLFVRKMDFFPAGLINHELFFQWTGIPIQVMKIIIGIMMIFFVIQIIAVFETEKESMIKERFAAKIVASTKEKMNREIHDHIIQKMFGASLKIEAYLSNANKEYLSSAKDDLKHGIGDARDIMSSSSEESYHAADLSGLIQDLLAEKKREAPFAVIFQDNIPRLSHGKVTGETASQIYYILQEALTNAIKHSQAENVHVRLREEYDFLIIEVEDDGIGLKATKNDNRPSHEEVREKLGMDIMKKRAEEIGAKLIIEGNVKGVSIRLIVKWEAIS